jgi:hypothetical protein
MRPVWSLGANGAGPFFDLTPGNHSIRLSEVPENCTMVDGDNPRLRGYSCWHRMTLSQVPENCTVADDKTRTVEVTSGDMASANFAVSCQ